MLDEQYHLIKQRKEAYAFIMEYFNNVKCDINQTKDTAVAEFSGISLEELIALKNGEANPSNDLITKMHQANISRGCDSMLASLIERFLVEQF